MALAYSRKRRSNLNGCRLRYNNRSVAPQRLEDAAAPKEGVEGFANGARGRCAMSPVFRDTLSNKAKAGNGPEAQRLIRVSVVGQGAVMENKDTGGTTAARGMAPPSADYSRLCAAHFDRVRRTLS